MVLVVAPRNVSRAGRILDGLKETHYRIGRVVAAKRGARARVHYL
jgi:phosphoribosylaminoimidazole (AIR) synthetase